MTKQEKALQAVHNNINNLCPIERTIFLDSLCLLVYRAASSLAQGHRDVFSNDANFGPNNVPVNDEIKIEVESIAQMCVVLSSVLPIVEKYIIAQDPGFKKDMTLIHDAAHSYKELIKQGK